jgi:hypothetical protein
MLSYLSKFLGYNTTSESSTLLDKNSHHNEFKSFINMNTTFTCKIFYDANKTINHITFISVVNNIYLLIYSHPTWNSIDKTITYKLRCNELFYPQRKTINAFCEIINYYGEYYDICSIEDNTIIFKKDNTKYKIVANNNYLNIEF